MFNSREIKRAVALQERSYRLLRWLASEILNGAIAFDHAARYASVSEGAGEWITRHFESLPTDGRPLSRDPGDIKDFANIFTTYLTTSFDLVEKPGTRLAFTKECGPTCPFCRWFEAAPHLRTKRLTRSDKERALHLELEYVNRLAKDEGSALLAERVSTIAQDPEMKESLAMAAYGDHLLRRVHGRGDGPAVLALWRQFAWKPEGSPKKGFKLRPQAIVDSENRVVAYLKG